MLPHAQFAKLVRLKPKNTGLRREKDVIATTAAELRSGARAALEPYLGYYFTYYNSMSHPGLILRALTCLYATPHGVNVKSVESVGRPGARKFTCKYEGACFMLGDRLFMTVMEMMTRNEVMQIILYPSYNSRINVLSGVVSGVAARAPRPPATTQMVLQYLGRSVALQAAMRQCALYPPDDPEIPEDIRRMLSPERARAHALMEAPLG